ncbi:MAG: CYTH domain-containing protein [Oscillospiraceae bacterium]|nr:CYTH domain-containing protein [Oscillospiraceae bacterium]MDD6081955.1 CYTH domain-containing protein [Oscillospiraceae bacterium]
MKETEYKFLVDKDFFYSILEMIKENYTEADYSEKVQINYYYDTAERYLLDNHTTLRIRQTEDGLKLELKEAQQLTGNDFSTCTEHTENIDAVRNDITLDRGKYAWIPFSLQGNLVTHRTSIRPSDSLSIDFDVNFYLGKCDYEIEMEFKEKAEKGTRLLVEKLGLMQYKNTVGGKARRFFRFKAEIL